MRNAMKVFAGATAGALLAVLAAQGLEAVAEVSPGATFDDVTRVIPYHGRIERHGDAFTGDVDMRFSIYSAETGGTLRWREEHSPSAGSGRVRIAAYAGEFSARLGTYDVEDATDDLMDVVHDAADLWLAIEVRLPGQSAYTALSGRQRLTAAPYAMWTAQGASFEVTEDVAVEGTLTVNGFTLASRVFMPASDARIALGFSAAGAGLSGKHGLVFVDAGTTADDGGQLAYDTSSNQLQFLKKDGTTTNFVIDVDDSSLTTRAKLTLATNTTATTTLGQKVTVASGRHTRTDTYGAVTLQGTQNASYMGVAFGDSDGGIQMVYDTSNNALVFEVGEAMQNGTDLLVFDRDDATMTVSSGNVLIGGKLIHARQAKSGGSEIDAHIDKVYAADASCTIGAIQVGKNGNWASICGCFNTNAERDRGWYCWD